MKQLSIVMTPLVAFCVTPLVYGGQQQPRKSNQLAMAQQVQSPREQCDLNDALRKATIHSDRKKIEWLLKHGADPNEESPRDRTVFDLACSNLNNASIVTLFLKYGADIERGNHDKTNTPLLTALLTDETWRDDELTAVTLLKHGASIPELKPHLGRYSFSHNKRLNVARIILEIGRPFAQHWINTVYTALKAKKQNPIPVSIVQLICSFAHNLEPQPSNNL